MQVYFQIKKQPFVSMRMNVNDYLTKKILEILTDNKLAINYRAMLKVWLFQMPLLN